MRTLLIAALAAATTGPPHAWLVDGGASLVGHGARLFPAIAGRPVAGWLAAAEGPTAHAVWEGYSERHTLDARTRALVWRSRGLVAVYALEHGSDGERCVGQIIFEPRRLPDPAGAERALRRAGFAVRRGFFVAAGARSAVDAGTFERRAGGTIERYAFARLPAPAGAAPPQHLVEEAWYPARLAPRLESWSDEGRRAIAEFFATRGE